MEQEELCEVRASCTVLWEARGETPRADPTSGHFMKTNILILIFSIFLLTSFKDNPCQKKTQSRHNSNMHYVITYPNCKDTTTYSSRCYENGKLYWEMVVLKNKKTIETTFSAERNNVITTQTFFENDKASYVYSYYEHPSILKSVQKYESDTSSFITEYYQNGNIKEYGHESFPGCPTGQFVEFDSLGNFKWTGAYVRVNKTKVEKNEYGDVEIFTCSEKNGIWYKTNKIDQRVDSIVYVDGKIKNAH